MIIFLLYLIIGVVLSYYFWENLFSVIEFHLTEEDFEAARILYFLFGLFIWPLYVYEYLRQKFNNNIKN
jgi:hypothetical protein